MLRMTVLNLTYSCYLFLRNAHCISKNIFIFRVGGFFEFFLFSKNRPQFEVFLCNHYRLKTSLKKDKILLERKDFQSKEFR